MNKRLVIIFSSIVVAVMLVVLGAVILTVGNVQVVTNDEQGIYDMTNIVNESGIKRGTSIFAVDEEKATRNIEKSYPYAKVIKIERKFPNKVVIEMVNRSPVFCLPVNGQDDYILLDREFKVLEIVKKQDYDNALTLIKGCDYVCGDGENIQNLVGEYLDLSINPAYQTMHECLLAFEDYGDVNERFTAMVGSIEWVEQPSREIIVGTNLGIKMAFMLGTNKSIAEQLKLVYNKLNGLDNEVRESEMYIYMNTAGEVKISEKIEW